KSQGPKGRELDELIPHPGSGWAVSAQNTVLQACATGYEPAASLEFRVDAQLDIRRRISFLADVSAEEIEITQKSTTADRGNLEVLDPGIARLQTDPIFVVLHDGVVQLQFVQRRKDVVGPVTFVIQITDDSKLPIVS